MAITGEDHFQDTAGANLSTHIMDVGGSASASWTQLNGSLLLEGASTPGLRNSGTNTRGVYVNNTVAPGARQCIGCVITAKATLLAGNQAGIGLGFPTSGTNQDCYDLNVNALDTAGNVSLVAFLRSTTGAGTTLINSATISGWTATVAHTVSMMRDTSNTDIIVSLDGSPIYLIREGTITRNGRAGVTSGGTTQTSVQGYQHTDWFFDNMSDAPTNSVRPTIDNTTPHVGDVLTASPGTWSAGDTFSYQWMSLDASGTGQHFSAIAGATQSTYTVQSGDAGKTIICVIRRSTGAPAANLVGVGTRATASTSAVVYPAPTNLTVPTLSGAGISGANATRDIVINTTDGTWLNKTAQTYRWQKSTNGGGTYTDIVGATSNSYIPVSGDVGALVRSAVDATNNGAGPTTAFSAAVTIVPPVPANNIPPTITGTGFVGDVHTVSNNGAWTESPTSYTYQWVESTNGGTSYSPVFGATNNTYTPGNGEAGDLLAVQVTAHNAGGASAPVRSNAISLATSFSSSTVTIGLTGGSSNNDYRVSLGGFRSTAIPNVGDGIANAVMQDITTVQAFAGYIDYVALAVRNSSSVNTWDNATAWLTIPTTSPDDEVYLAVDTSPVNTPGVTIPNNTTSPPFDFVEAIDSASAVEIGTLTPGDWKILWFKRVVNARANRAVGDTFTLHIEGTVHGTSNIVARELHVIYSINPPAQMGFSYITQTSGLVGTIGMMLKNIDTGDITIPFSTTGIVEDFPGHYVASRDAITVPGNYEIFWSTAYPLTLGSFDSGPFTLYDYALQDLGVAVDQITAGMLFALVDSYTGVNGSVAHVLNSILAKDPLNTTIPGGYPLGTAGAALSRIASGVVETTPVVSANGGVVNLVIGRDYFAVDGVGLTFTDQGANWPDLSGAVVTLEVMDQADDFNTSFTVTGIANPASGDSKVITFDVSATETDLLNADRPYKFEARATLSNGHVVSLVIGKVNALRAA